MGEMSLRKKLSSRNGESLFVKNRRSITHIYLYHGRIPPLLSEAKVDTPVRIRVA